MGVGPGWGAPGVAAAASEPGETRRQSSSSSGKHLQQDSLSRQLESRQHAPAGRAHRLLLSSSAHWTHPPTSLRPPTYIHICPHAHAHRQHSHRGAGRELASGRGGVHRQRGGERGGGGVRAGEPACCFCAALRCALLSHTVFARSTFGTTPWARGWAASALPDHTRFGYTHLAAGHGGGVLRAGVRRAAGALVAGRRAGGDPGAHSVHHPGE